MFILIGRTLFCPVAGFIKFYIHSIFPELGSIHVIQIKKSKRPIPVSQLWFEITRRSQLKKKKPYFQQPLIMDLKCDLEWLDLESVAWFWVAWLPGVVFTVDVLRNQCVLWHGVVILQTAFVWKVVSGDRERGGHSQGLPVHACGKPNRVSFPELTRTGINSSQRTKQKQSYCLITLKE